MIYPLLIAILTCVHHLNAYVNGGFSHASKVYKSTQRHVPINGRYHVPSISNVGHLVSKISKTSVFPALQSSHIITGPNPIVPLSKQTYVVVGTSRNHINQALQNSALTPKRIIASRQPYHVVKPVSKNHIFSALKINPFASPRNHQMPNFEKYHSINPFFKQYSNPLGFTRNYIGSSKWPLVYNRLQSERQRQLQYNALQKKELIKHQLAAIPVTSVSQRRTEVPRNAYLRWQQPNRENELRSNIIPQNQMNIAKLSYGERGSNINIKRQQMTSKANIPAQQRFIYHTQNPLSYASQRNNAYKRNYHHPGDIQLLSKSTLLRKIEILKNVKKAIIARHKLDVQSALVKKQMLQWGKKQMMNQRTQRTKIALAPKSKVTQIHNNKISKPPLKKNVIPKIPLKETKSNSAANKKFEGNSYKKTLVPHTITRSWHDTPGVKRHHIFHETTHEKEIPYDNQWEYSKYHVFHEISPSDDTFKKKRVTVPNNDHTESDTDDEDDDTNLFNDDNSLFPDDDLEDDDDMPTISNNAHQSSKVPILNIETPNMKDVPDNERRQLDNSAASAYNVDKGVPIQPLHEPIMDEFIADPKMKDEDSEKKSSVLNDEMMLNDFMAGDLSGKHVKEKMSDEEVEALREDQDASKMMKVPDKSKLDEQPEVLGVDKQGMNTADRAAISATFSNGAVSDPGFIGREGIDSSSIETSKENQINQSPIDHHLSDVNQNEMPHTLETGKEQTEVGTKKNDEHPADRQTIDNSENDLHHPMSEMDNNQSQTKKSNDYEPYENNDQDEGMYPYEHQSDYGQEHEHVNEHEHSDIKLPLDINVSHGTSNLEDTIKKLQANDALESESLVKKYTSKMKHPLDNLQDYKSTISMKNQPEIKTDEDNPSNPSNALNSQQTDDNSDLLDPLKAQDRLNHFSEAAEIANKIHRNLKESNAASTTNTFVKDQYPSTADIADSLLKSNPNGNGHSQLLPFPSKQISNSAENFSGLKFDSISPEDAIHALNGKASLSDILARALHSESNAPPDAVVNSIESPSAFANNLVKTTKESLDKKKEAEKAAALQEKKVNNSTVTNIAISDIENATVAKEVISILESLGQVKTSLQPEKNNSITEPTPIVKAEIAFNSTAPPVQSSSEDSSTRKTVSAPSTSNQTLINTTLPGESKSENLPNDDAEEKETKEAVHDLNIAIGILEKKLALMNEAKKSGNKKAIYIVDQALRNSKTITKSNIFLPRRKIRKNHRRTKHHKDFNYDVSSHTEEETMTGKSLRIHEKHKRRRRRRRRRRHRRRHFRRHKVNKVIS